jgi:hypothetical protein
MNTTRRGRDLVDVGLVPGGTVGVTINQGLQFCPTAFRAIQVNDLEPVGLRVK